MPYKQQRRTIHEQQPLTPVSVDDGAEHTVPELGFEVGPPPYQTTASDISTGTETLRFMHRNMLRKHFSKDSEYLTVTSSLSNVKDYPNRRSTWNNAILHSSHLKLGDAKVEQYLYKYDHLFYYFPFLPLPTGWSVKSMRKDHSFFLLGIVSAMTMHDVEINAQVHAQFLRVLAERVVVRGEKTLDIVQGILVQLAWYPIHLNPFGRQIFQIVQMASAITVELGLDETIKPAESVPKSIAYNTNDMDASSLSVRRTQAACYHLSSVIAVSFHRKNHFPYLERPDRQYAPVPQDGDGLPENLIFVHARLQDLVEQAETASKNRRLDVFGAITVVDTLTNEMYGIFEVTRKELCEQREAAHDAISKRSGIANKVSPALMKLAKHFVELQIQSIAITRPNSSATTSLISNDVQDRRHAALLRCLRSSKAFFETFFSLPISEYRDMAFAERCRVVLTLTIVAKLCFDIPGFPQWDSAWARKEVQFGMIVESLCYRMQELTSTGKSPKPKDAALPPDHFFMMKSVLQILKEVYDEAVAETLKTSEEEREKRKQGPGCPVLNGELMNTDFWDALEYSHVSGVDPLLDCNWNLTDPNTWNWDWDATI
ncbi:MAG: hypothetical protein M1820_005974 [Bogoriella megaspora]|nr:MAG: hypothetical protein M1820_005974 [Bogoriella megaspora]